MIWVSCGFWSMQPQYSQFHSLGGILQLKQGYWTETQWKCTESAQWKDVVAVGTHIHFECGVSWDGQQQISVYHRIVLTDASLPHVSVYCTHIQYMSYMSGAGGRSVAEVLNKNHQVNNKRKTYFQQKFRNSCRDPSVGCTWLPLIHTAHLSCNHTHTQLLLLLVGF